MPDIHFATLGRDNVTEPAVTEFVDGVAALLKAELLQAFAAQRDPAASTFRVATQKVGVTNPVEVDSVAKVVIEQWYAALPQPTQVLVLRAAPRRAQLDPRTVRLLRDQPIRLQAEQRVLEQVDLASHLRGFDFADIRDRLIDRTRDLAVPADSSATTAVNTALELQITRVTCVDETDPEFFGKDRIAMGGTAIDHRERVTKVGQFVVGEFDTGDRRNYDPPKVVKKFSLSGGEFPKTFAVVLGMAEKDNGGFGDFLTELYQAVKGELTIILAGLGTAAGAALATAIGGTVGAVVGGPAGIVIGIAAGLIVAALVEFLASIAQDDLFQPQVALATLPTADATLPGGSLLSPAFNLNYIDFAGRYRVRCNWKLRR